MGDSCEMMRDLGLGHSDRVLQATVSGSRIRLLKPYTWIRSWVFVLSKATGMGTYTSKV